MTTRTLTDTATITQDVTTSGQLKLNVPASVTLTTPNIGAATATSVNKVEITAPATSATLTIANGKTLTVWRSLTLDGTEGSVTTFGDASGQYSASLGAFATATAASSTAIGVDSHATADSASAFGANASASGQNSVAFGPYSSASGPFSGAIGGGADTKGVTRQARSLYDSKVQRFEHYLFRTTADATPTILTSTGGAVSATNQNTLANNSCQSFRGRVIGFTSDSTAACGFEFSGLIRRTANAASTALVSAVTPVAIGTPDAALSTASVAVTADTTNGALAVTVTGVAATTINWTCVVDSELRAT
jgi:hypothetical protein